MGVSDHHTKEEDIQKKIPATRELEFLTKPFEVSKRAESAQIRRLISRRRKDGRGRISNAQRELARNQEAKLKEEQKDPENNRARLDRENAIPTTGTGSTTPGKL